MADIPVENKESDYGKVPSRVCSSVAFLAQYLVKPARNDMSKVRAILMWIAETISLNEPACFTENIEQQTSDVVLKNRFAQSEGIARLFLDLCKTRKVDLQNITCKLIERNSKEDFKQYVLLRKEGEVFSVNVTPPADGKYDLKLFGIPAGSTDTRFHWVSSLTIVCLSVTDVVRPYPDPNLGFRGANMDAYRYGFINDIFEYDVIKTTKVEIKIEIRTVVRVPVRLKLCQAEKRETVHSFKPDLEKFTFEYYDGDTLFINVRFPRAGFYKLTIFAEYPENKTDRYERVADFLIDRINDRITCSLLVI